MITRRASSWRAHLHRSSTWRARQTNGVRASDEDAEVTLIATAETFQDIMAGALDPTSAFMSGKLRIEGDMGTAMRLSGVL